MKKVLFLTSYASPYRVRFFDALAEYCDVTVLFSDRAANQSHRDASWFVEGEGKARFVQLQKVRASHQGRDLCTDVIGWLKKPFDVIVVCGYSSPTTMLAMAYLRLKKIPFYMEVDGGIVRGESKLKYLYKKALVSTASFWLSTGENTTDYLVHYGAKRENVFTFPFSSLDEMDLLPRCVPMEEKLAIRRELGLSEEKILLTIGQFIPRKGFDILMKSMPSVAPGTGVYIVGGEPTEEYLQMQKDLQLSNVHFVGFQKKDALARFYQAADAFVLPTREDIWGLVINEAMAYGLPVVTTDRCVAGVELVEDGVNGYLVPVEDEAALAEKLNMVLSRDLQAMGSASLEKIRPYTIENMAKRHLTIFEQNLPG